MPNSDTDALDDRDKLYFDCVDRLRAVPAADQLRVFWHMLGMHVYCADLSDDLKESLDSVLSSTT